MVLTEIQNGKRPMKPANAVSLGVTDSIWMLLGQCWDWEPRYRPDSAHVLNVLREAHMSRDAGAVTSTRLKLKMEDVSISLTRKRKINPYVTLQYGSRVYTTPCATCVGGNKYTWCEPFVVSAHLFLINTCRNDVESWTITLDRQCHGQVITIRLCHRGFFRRRENLGTGKFSVKCFKSWSVLLFCSP